MTEARDARFRTQDINLASLILGQNSIWGDLTAISPRAVTTIPEKEPEVSETRRPEMSKASDDAPAPN